MFSEQLLLLAQVRHTELRSAAEKQYAQNRAWRLPRVGRASAWARVMMRLGALLIAWGGALQRRAQGLEPGAAWMGRSSFPGLGGLQ